MSKHLFGIAVTPFGTAANNRGETEGNITTLQKILWNNELHTTVSAEAIRWAIRYYWQMKLGADKLNRYWVEEQQQGKDMKPMHCWRDHEFKAWRNYIDDDVLGFMSAESAKEEASDAEGTPETDKKKKRGSAKVRRARLEVTRAISLTPFAGDITFNAASVGATPSASSTGKDPVPYGTEVHATRYQYGLALTPEDLADKSRALAVIEAIVNLNEVAGNQARFLFDFSPESVIFRWTDDFAPRMLYAFKVDAEGRPTVPALLQRVAAGDISPAELIVGGPIADTADGAALKQKGAFVVPGVKAAAKEFKERIRKDLGLK